MISRAEVDKLLTLRADEPSVVSLYLRVPVDVTGLAELPARADELFSLSADEQPQASRPQASRPQAGRVGKADRDTVRRLLAAGARDWLGHSVAIFASSQLGLAEAIPLPVQVQDRAVLGVRPHVRPLLLAIQQSPAHRVVVADRRHAWLFSIAGERISTTALPDADLPRNRSFGGWYGLEAYNVNENVRTLARLHYRDVASLLEQAARADGAEPLIIGAHRDTIRQVLAALPPGLRDTVAGSFVADIDTLTSAKVRDLAARVVQDWVNQQDEQLQRQLSEAPPDGLTVSGLAECLTAAYQHAIRLVAIPEGGLLPGYACSQCDALSSDGNGCPHGPEAARPVPDLLEELAVHTLADGGLVSALKDPPGGVAALLRFPLAR